MGGWVGVGGRDGVSVGEREKGGREGGEGRGGEGRGGEGRGGEGRSEQVCKQLTD